MRILTAILLLLFGSASAEPIPARDPFFGESRPSWWWDIWHGRVVVLEGKITFKKSERPDIHIEFNEEQIDRIIPDKKTRDLQSKLRDYYVGDLEISKFHYADGGAMDADGRLKQMQSGDLKRVKVMIPIQRFGDLTTLFGAGLEPDAEDIGIHVFDYNQLILGLNLVHNSRVPPEKLADAQQVFELREKLVHCGVNRISHPNRGYAGFLIRGDGDDIIVGNVIAGTPADKAGLKVGDTILSLNGENMKVPDLNAEMKFYSKIKDWRVGDQLDIEVNRENEKHKISLVLISGKGLQAAKNSEEGGADQPATQPADKAPMKDQPSPSTPKDVPR